MKKLVYPLLTLLAMSVGAFAGTETVQSKQTVAPLPELCFQDREFQLDLFGSYTDSLEQNPHSDGFGGGIALNYFFIRNLGIGVDGNVFDGNANGVWAPTGRLIVRFPIDSACIAPYVFGGGGYEVNGDGFGTAHAGGGLEFRVKPNLGVFGEGRYTWGESDRDSAQYRVGLRFVF
jgi:hypothetical protein